MRETIKAKVRNASPCLTPPLITPPPGLRRTACARRDSTCQPRLPPLPLLPPPTFLQIEGWCALPLSDS